MKTKMKNLSIDYVKNNKIAIRVRSKEELDKFNKLLGNNLNYLKLYCKDFHAIDTMQFMRKAFILASDNCPSVPKNSSRGKG